ncbi:MAG: hypothetical protein HON23_01230 [Rickettsiales bacterium]|jgi:hypothetical protein|nr:hypothetical protein [Rickettsiales bacterium]
MKGKNKKAEIMHTSITCAIGNFYEEWKGNPNYITTAENIIITGSSLEGLEPALFLPRLNCSSLVFHNCLDVNSGSLGHMIGSCDWGKMREFTILFDEQYTHESTVHETDVDSLLRLIKTQIEGLSHVQRLGARHNLTFTCNGFGGIDEGNRRPTYDYANSFKIILNDSAIEPFARSTA